MTIFQWKKVWTWKILRKKTILKAGFELVTSESENTVFLERAGKGWTRGRLRKAGLNMGKKWRIYKSGE